MECEHKNLIQDGETADEVICDDCGKVINTLNKNKVTK